MKIGISIAQCGTLAEGPAVRTTALAAEELGYSSVWVLDRLLAPVAPRTRYPATEDGELPEEQGTILDPLAVLAHAAAVTERVRLGTSVLVVPWYRPVLLARSLASVDRLSGGRLTVGVGLGWSADEYEAVGVPQSQLGDRLEEALDAFDAAWGPDPVHFEGERFRIAPSTIGAKPVQAGGPPILLAAYTARGLDRIGRRAAGWNPAGLPVEALAPMWGHVQLAAAAHGRDPESLDFVVRANITLTAEPLGSARPSYYGSVDQVAADLAATEDAGAHEVILGLYGDPTAEQAVEQYGELRNALERRLVAA